MIRSCAKRYGHVHRCAFKEFSTRYLIGAGFITFNEDETWHPQGSQIGRGINSPNAYGQPLLKLILQSFYPPTKSEGYSFGVVRASVHLFRLSGTISQYLLVRFYSFLVLMISTMDSRYSISLVQIDSLTLELLPLY